MAPASYDSGAELGRVMFEVARPFRCARRAGGGAIPLAPSRPRAVLVGRANTRPELGGSTAETMCTARIAQRRCSLTSPRALFSALRGPVPPSRQSSTPPMALFHLVMGSRGVEPLIPARPGPGDLCNRRLASAGKSEHPSFEHCLAGSAAEPIRIHWTRCHWSVTISR